MRDSGRAHTSRATPEEQIEYEGLILDHCLVPVINACLRKAESYVTQATPPKSWQTRRLNIRYASSSGTACRCDVDITLTYVAKHWIHDAMSVTARFWRDAAARGGPDVDASFAPDDAQNSGRSLAISVNSQRLILSASLIGTGSRPSPT